MPESWRPIFRRGLTADCTGLAVEEATRLLLMTRPTFGGNIMATIYCQHRRPQMSTVRPRVMKLPERGPVEDVYHPAVRMGRP